MLSPAPGTLLVAEPPMSDPNFRRTVVLLCDHTVEGSFGLVLNRPAGVRLAQAATLTLPFDADLWIGGPVQPETLHYLHPYGHDLDGALPVLDDVFWGGDFEQVRAGIEQGYFDAARFRFFVGYSGWGAGQLDAEVDEGSWIVLHATAEMAFTEQSDALWRQILRELGGEYALLSTFPDDPRLN
ncbi:MAG: YqgE/AlgH family protein [Rubricoccaceae bacterium]